jgi:uncharacterized protein
VCPNVIVAEPPSNPAVPDAVPPSEEGLEAVGRQRFIWSLVAGFPPVCGLPVVWGFAMLEWQRAASTQVRWWSRRLLALAILDTVVAVACMHLAVMAKHGVVTREVRAPAMEARADVPALRGLFEPVSSGEFVLPRRMRKDGVGIGLVAVSLVGLWAVGRRRGGDPRPLGVLAVLGVAGLGAWATMRGGSALLGGPSRGTMMLSVWAQAGILLLASGWIVRRGATSPEEPVGRGWLRTYFESLGLLVTLGMRVVVLLAWLSQVLASSPEKNAHPMLELARQGPLGVLGWGLLIIPAALLAPIGEELLFRGVLLPWLRGWLGRVEALVVSAGLFAVLHLFYGVFIGWIFFLGLMLGWARLTSGGLRAPILLHATVNTFGLLMFARSLMGG